MNDPRINFVCQDLPEITDHIDSFSPSEDLNNKLDSFIFEILNDKVNIDTMQAEVKLPKVF